MATGKNRTKQKAAKEQRKKNQLQSSGQSSYAKKAEFLKKNGGMGYDYSAKPWK